MVNIDNLDLDDALMIGSDHFRAIMKVYIQDQKKHIMQS